MGELKSASVLAAWKQIFGKEHLTMLATATNLALTCGKLGRLAEEEDLEAWVLEASKQVRRG